VTLARAYVVVLPGVTTRVAGLAAIVWVNPSDQPTVHGPVPVRFSVRVAEPPSHIAWVPESVAVGRGFTVTVTAFELAVQPALSVTETS